MPTCKFEEITRQLKLGHLRPIYLLVGSEAFLIESLVMRIIKQGLGTTKSSPNLITVSGQEISGALVYQTALTVPLFGSRKVIWIKDCDSLKEKEKLQPYFQKPSSKTVLILSSAKVDLRTKFWKEVTKCDQTIVYKAYPLFDHQLPGWIANQAKQLGCSIEPAAVRLMIQLIGNDLSALSLELEKITLLLADSKKITVATVEQTVADIRKFTVFELVDLVGNRDLPGSLKVFYSLTAEGEHPLKLLTMLVRQLRLIWQGKQLQKKNLPSSQITSQLGIFYKNEHSFLRQLDQFSEARLRKSLLLCQDLDLKLKSTATPSIYLMTDLLVELQS